MVRDGENPRRVEAVCCNVEVVNGGRGLRLASLSLRSVITQVDDSPISLMRSASACLPGSSVQIKGIFIPLASVLAVRVK